MDTTKALLCWLGLIACIAALGASTTAATGAHESDESAPMTCLRTPDSEFENLPGYDFEPHYLSVDDPGREPGNGFIRVHYTYSGPSGAPTLLLMHGNPSRRQCRPHQRHRHLRTGSGEMTNLLLGIAIGVSLTWLYGKRRRGLSIPWYSWPFFALGAASLVMAFDVLRGSYLEHEIRAAWLGFGLFGTLAVALVAGGWCSLSWRAKSRKQAIRCG